MQARAHPSDEHMHETPNTPAQHTQHKGATRRRVDEAAKEPRPKLTEEYIARLRRSKAAPFLQSNGNPVGNHFMRHSVQLLEAYVHLKNRWIQGFSTENL